MGKGKAFLFLCLSFVGGIFLSSLVDIPQEILWGFFILGLVFIVSLWRDKRFVIIGFCLILFGLGIFRHEQAVAKSSELAVYNDKGIVTLRGVISKEPDIRRNTTRLTFNAREIVPDVSDISGKVLMIAPRYPEYKYGDELEIIGELKTPQEDIDGFNYKKYLQKEGVYSVIYWPEIRKISENKGNFLYTKLFYFKNLLRNSIYKNLPSPQSEILLAILFGEEKRIPEDLIQKFNVTGTRHIMAISGMNITLISQILFVFFLSLGLWRKHAFWASLAILTLFIIMIGMPASAVRAGIMGGAISFSEYIGRPKSAPRAVLYAALIMLFLNPSLLRFDVGFQLSFLATIGLIYFSPYISKFLKFLPDLFSIRSIAAMTIAAQLTTFPLLISTFGYFSVVSILTNILIISTLSFLMISGFISGFSGIFIEKIGQILSWPVWLILTYIISVIDFFASLPVASILLGKNLQWIWIVSYYLILFWFWRRFIKERPLLKTYSTPSVEQSVG